MKFPLSYDATITRGDFVRLLPQATGCEEIQELDDRFCGRGWSVRLTPISPLVIGMVRLERHRVEIEFDELSPEGQESFMRRFTLHYQRGGG
ncbi:MAG: hypothetical protein FIA96_08930 [Betaproteobacteria bacterium]|nr:hypothetical protein [Betaproteobacteria bacterium]